MTSDIDVWRAAILLIDQYGPDAGFMAAWSAGVMFDRGNSVARAIWRRIFKAIEELERTEREANEILN